MSWKNNHYRNKCDVPLPEKTNDGWHLYVIKRWLTKRTHKVIIYLFFKHDKEDRSLPLLLILQF